MTPNEELRQIRRSFKNGRVSLPVDREILVNCTEDFALSMTDTDAERLLRFNLGIGYLHFHGVLLLEWSWGKLFVLRYLRWQMRAVRISYRISPQPLRPAPQPRREKPRYFLSLVARVVILLVRLYIVILGLTALIQETQSGEEGEK